MPIYKRGKTYWFHFYWNGEHIQKSTRQGNPRVARQIEAAYKTQLAKGEVGIEQRKPVPRLKDFAQRFIDNIAVGRRRAPKPSTVEFYAWRLARLLDFEPLASARLDKIKPELIEAYVRVRRQRVSPTSVNRELTTLRRALNVAYALELIGRVPKITMLQGEHERTFVLTPAQERLYLEFTPQPLKDMAILLLDTGLRVGEALALQWNDVHLEHLKNAKFGYVHVRESKSKHSKRNVCLTERVSSMLERRQEEVPSTWVFTNKAADRPLTRFTLRDQHARLRAMLRLPSDFVMHSLRHTMLTRLGELGVDAFTIMRIAGHSTITVSQRYVHPSPEVVERAFERLEAFSRQESTKTLEGQIRTAPATVSATPAGPHLLGGIRPPS